MNKIAIIGAGSCGTALAIALRRSREPHCIALWAHGADVLAALRTNRENSVYLPGIPVPGDIEVTANIGEALAGANIVVGAMPSKHARAVYTTMLPHLFCAKAVQDREQKSAARGTETETLAHRLPIERIIFVSATKGIEQGSLARMTEVAAQVLGAALRETGSKNEPRIAALSGPSFALEMARGDPTAVVIASHDAEAAACVQNEFSGATLRLYTNDDVVGTEVGGAVKNVIAIAAGVCAGLGLGDNSIAALVTRGLAEMTRLAMSLGGRRDTLAGLAGLGDLILTATGSLSRNRAVGIALGKGRPLEEILRGMRMVAEGVGTTAATLALARRQHVEMPITEQMHEVLDQSREPREAMRELMERRLKQE